MTIGTLIALVSLAATVAGWFISIGRAKQQLADVVEQLNGLGGRVKNVELLTGRVDQLEARATSTDAELRAAAQERGRLQGAIASSAADVGGIRDHVHAHELALENRLTRVETFQEVHRDEAAGSS